MGFCSVKLGAHQYTSWRRSLAKEDSGRSLLEKELSLPMPRTVLMQIMYAPLMRYCCACL